MLQGLALQRGSKNRATYLTLTLINVHTHGGYKLLCTIQEGISKFNSLSKKSLAEGGDRIKTPLPHSEHGGI